MSSNVQLHLGFGSQVSYYERTSSSKSVRAPRNSHTDDEPKGALCTFSTGGVSAIQSICISHPSMAKDQWVILHMRCHKICSPMVVFTAVCSLWLRYQTGKNIYLAAAMSCLAIVPYTVLLLTGSERTILSSNSQREKPSQGHASSISHGLRQWKTRNMLRGLFPLIGGVCILVSYLS